MGHLVEAVLGRHRTYLHRLEKNIVAWIACHSPAPVLVSGPRLKAATAFVIPAEDGRLIADPVQLLIWRMRAARLCRSPDCWARPGGWPMRCATAAAATRGSISECTMVGRWPGGGGWG